MKISQHIFHINPHCRKKMNRATETTVIYPRGAASRRGRRPREGGPPRAGRGSIAHRRAHPRPLSHASAAPAARPTPTATPPPGPRPRPERPRPRAGRGRSAARPARNPRGAPSPASTYTNSLAVMCVPHRFPLTLCPRVA